MYVKSKSYFCAWVAQHFEPTALVCFVYSRSISVYSRLCWLSYFYIPPCIYATHMYIAYIQSRCARARAEKHTRRRRRRTSSAGFELDDCSNPLQHQRFVQYRLCSGLSKTVCLFRVRFSRVAFVCRVCFRPFRVLERVCPRTLCAPLVRCCGRTTCTTRAGPPLLCFGVCARLPREPCVPCMCFECMCFIDSARHIHVRAPVLSSLWVREHCSYCGAWSWSEKYAIHDQKNPHTNYTYNINTEKYHHLSEILQAITHTHIIFSTRFVASRSRSRLAPPVRSFDVHSVIIKI